MFSSWDEIKKHAEVVKFAVGLKGNQSTKQETKQVTNGSTNESSIENTGSSLVNHVYQVLTGKILQKMRKGKVILHSDYEFNLLIDIVHEMKSRSGIINGNSNEDEDDDETNIEDDANPFDPLCNRHFYYVTKLPLKIQSTMYVFGTSHSLQEIQTHGRRTDSMNLDVTEPCTVVIDSPCLEAHRVLEAVSYLKQSITDLYINKLNIESTNEDATLNRIMADLHILGSETGQSDPFKWKDQLFQIDQHAKSIQITLEGCSLPQNVQTNLGRQISICNELQCLKIPKQPFITKAVVHNLGQNVGLKYLDVSECHLRHRRVQPMGFPNISPLPLLNQANFAGPLSMQGAFGFHGGLFGGPSSFQGGCYPAGACGLSEDLCSVLCQELKSLVQLEVLNLSNNLLGTKGAHHLAESIRSWGSDSSLQELNLSVCQMQECGTLLESLASCKKMATLDLSGNNLNDLRDGDKLAQSVKSSLVRLNLSGCGIKDSSRLMEVLGTCKDLQTLYLSNNQIGAEGSRNLARSIRSWGQSSLLRQLLVNSCQLYPDGSAELLSALSACPALIHLDISGNEIGTGLQGLNAPSGFQRLIELEMNNTPLTELDVQVLGDIVCKGGIPRLSKFTLCGCQISSSAAAHLMASVSSCRDLKTLNLSNNSIGGAFHHLYASRNPIVGDLTVPKESPLTPGSLPGYPLLRHLCLKETSLRPADIQALAVLVTDRRMPSLNTIVIGWDKLAIEAAAIKEKMMSEQLNSLLTAFQKGPGAAMQALSFLDVDGKEDVAKEVDEYQHLFTDEPEEMLDALATILQNVNHVNIMEGDITLDKRRIEKLIDAERNRRSNLQVGEP